MILTYQSVLCHHVFSGLFCLFFLSSYLFVCLFVFLAFFSPPSFRVFYDLLSVLRGCFNRRNTSFSLALLYLSFPFLFFSFSSFLFLSSLLFLFSLSMQIFGAPTAAMPHRFRRACSNPHPKIGRMQGLFQNYAKNLCQNLALFHAKIGSILVVFWLQQKFFPKSPSPVHPASFLTEIDRDWKFPHPKIREKPCMYL